MTTKQIKLTDRQISKLSALLDSKFTLNTVFNVKSFGEMYKRAMIQWLVRSPAKIGQILNQHFEVILLEVIGLKKGNWGSYQVVGGSRISEYLKAIFEKLLKDQKDTIEAKAKLAFKNMLDRLEPDTWDLKKKLGREFESIIEEEIKSLETVLKNQIRAKIQLQLNDVFKEINESIDLAAPDSLKTEWSELMIELQLLKGEL